MVQLGGSLALLTLYSLLVLCMARITLAAQIETLASVLDFEGYEYVAVTTATSFDEEVFVQVPCNTATPGEFHFHLSY